MHIKTEPMWYKVFHINLVAGRKSKVSLNINKPAEIGMCVLELSEVLMYEFQMATLKINKPTN